MAIPSADACIGIRLREVTDTDLPVFFAHQSDADANRMADFPARDWDAFMTHWTKIRADPTVWQRTVLYNGQVAGNVVCWKHDGRLLVGYWIGKEHWGRGIATQALRLFLELVTERPLHAEVAKHNVASIRVLEKCGFTICAKSTETTDETGDNIEELFMCLGPMQTFEP